MKMESFKKFRDFSLYWRFQFATQLGGTEY